MTVQVILPYQLQNLAGTGREVELDVETPVTPRAILNALEGCYPMLKGAILDHATGERRPMLRFFACQEDFSHEPLDCELPEAVAHGKEAFVIVGAISGG
ncbi:MAG: MoaD/ThiS family protein [Pseudomonadales bacterium]|nr:MoaD/ThiS family protein [Pseudomonadales bacterium]